MHSWRHESHALTSAAIFAASNDSNSSSAATHSFDGIRTGVIVGAEFYYMANVQDEKKSGFVPITILKLHL